MPDMPTLRSRFRRLARDERGAVAVIAALTFPMLVGAMALGSEAGYWYLSQRKLQQASDLAAYAGAVQLRSGRGESEMSAAALGIASASGFRAGEDTLDFRWPPEGGARKDDPRAVEVVLMRRQQRYFTLIYSSEPVAFSARAVAEVRGGQDACLLSLDPTVGGAITVSGSSEVTFGECDVATNSNAANAFHMSGGKVELTGGCVHSVGGVEATTNLNLTDCSAPRTEAPVTRDPYADIAEPPVEGTCEDGNVGSNNQQVAVTPTETNSSGVPLRRYCGGLDLKGQVSFDPGLYIVGGGTLRINASTEVSGTGVTFFLTNGATLAFNGGATLDLTAPASGPFAGLLFFGDRDDVGAQHSINGAAGSQLDGAVYLPSADLSYSGNFSGANGCTQIVTRRIEFTGNSTLSVDCTGTGTRRIAVAESIALVE